MTQMFLERKGEVEISEYVLMAAACNRDLGYDIMHLFLEHAISVNITEDIIISALQFSSPNLVMDLLKHSEAKATTGCLLEAAVSNPYYGAELVRLLLTKEKITELPEAVFIKAAESPCGMKSFLVIEEIFGRIKFTESLMAKCVQRATPKTIGFLLSRVDPVHMTEEVWTCALKNGSHYSGDLEEVHHAVAEKSLYIPVTIETLVIAAQYAGLNLFRFLWSRGRRSSVPEDLTNAAAKSWEYGHDILDFLLHEVDYVEVGEATLIAFMANRWYADKYLDMLLEKGLQADTTDGVPETLLVNKGIKVKCSFPKPLRISKGMKVTEEVFRIAACVGSESLLERLSRFCELENIPEKWLDVARLYRAAIFRNEGLLKVLLGRGVKPNVASPDGTTPFVRAAQGDEETTVQLLLSAGALPDGGPNLKCSPLCYAARLGEIEMVKILVNAGASLDFKDEKGRTPSMIAKVYGEILVFRYLEQCRKEQERRRRETPNSK